MENDRSNLKPNQSNRFTVRYLLWELITALIPAVLIALFVNVFIAQAAMVEDGPSMQPNLYVGYRMMTEKVSYYFHEPQRGDIVVVEQPGGQVNLVKRVIGLQGETIELRAGHALINGKLIDEPWVLSFGSEYYAPANIPDDHIFIIGDNRPLSHDSRAIGPIPTNQIIGRVIFVYWPLNEFKFFP